MIITQPENHTLSTSSDEESLRQACRCAQIADEYRGANTVVLDLRKLTPIFDFFVITTGNSRRQMHAIAEEVDRVMQKEEQCTRRGLEGYQDSTWILEDYGHIVLHVFTKEARELYNLENLWADGETVDWRTVLNLPQETRFDM